MKKHYGQEADTLSVEKITKSMIFHSAEPFATSNQIAKYFGKPHNDLLKKIRSFHSFEELIKVGKISQLKRTYRGQDFPYFELDGDAFAFICLSITGKKAERFKWMFIEAFKTATSDAISARVALQVNYANERWVEARDYGKDTRKRLTDKIKDFCQYAEQQRGNPYRICPYYKLVTDAIYTYVGVSIPKAGQSPRDVYSGDIVEAIDAAELAVIDLLDEIMESNGNRKGIKPLIIDRLTHEMGHFI